MHALTCRVALCATSWCVTLVVRLLPTPTALVLAPIRPRAPQSAAYSPTSRSCDAIHVRSSQRLPRTPANAVCAVALRVLAEGCCACSYSSRLGLGAELLERLLDDDAHGDAESHVDKVAEPRRSEQTGKLGAHALGRLADRGLGGVEGGLPLHRVECHGEHNARERREGDLTDERRREQHKDDHRGRTPRRTWGRRHPT